MPSVLLIETATRVCSAGIMNDDGIVSIREDRSMEYSHSSLLTTFVESVVKDAGLGFSDLDAVAVSMGPGSYTGLRIGISAAKGFCYGLDIPLIAVSTLQSMVYCARLAALYEPHFFVPMIDARRMEVYSAVFDNNCQQVRDIQAEVVDGDSFHEYLEQGPVLFFGDGAAKCRQVLTHPDALFAEDIFPSVKGMVLLARERFEKKILENVAYFEPFYLKDFVAGKPRVKGLR